MQLTILGCGTSTGVPIPACRCEVCTSSNPKNKRDRCSALLTLDSGEKILIDAGPDLRQQALRFEIDRIDAVLFTHGHADHILGVEDLRGYNYVHRKPIPCYANKHTQAKLEQQFDYIFNPDPEYQGGALVKLEMNDIRPFEPLELFGVEIEPFELLHGPNDVVGFKIGRIAYATDCNFIPERSKDLLRNVDYLILDGLRHEQHSTHFSIGEAVAMAQELGAGQTYLTHMTHTIEYETENAKLPTGIEFCYDGLVIEL